MDEIAPSFRPPYMSFQTLWKFVNTLGGKPLPPQIDRSLMGTKSGTDQNNLTTTLTSLGLIGPGGVVQPALRELAEGDEESRTALLRSLVESYYPEALDLSRRNGTEQQLHETFRDTYALTAIETRRKAITFFLHAARKAGIPLSHHFPNTRSGSGSPGTPRAKRTPTKRKPNPADSSGAQGNGAAAVTQEGYSLTVRLRTGGTMTLLVDVNPLQLKGDEREFFYGVVDKMDGYATDNSTSSPATVEDQGAVKEESP